MKKKEGFTTDELLWDAFRQGSEQAYMQLFDRLYPALSAYGYRLCQHSSLTDDAIQELFIELWTKRGQLPMVSRVKPYLFSILKRKVWAALQREKMQISDTAFLHQDDLQALPYEAEQILAEQDSQMKLLLGRLLESLTVRQREILYLRFYENLTYEDIASVSEVKVSRVYNIVYEALGQMRKLAKNSGVSWIIFLCLKISGLIFFVKFS